MSGWRVRLAALGSMALLLAASQASAQQTDEDLLVLGYTVGPPSAALIAFDAAMLVSLATDGTARRGFAINGLIFSSIDGVMALQTLAMSSGTNVRGVSPILLPLSCAALALAAASGVLSIYALFHPPLPPPRARAPLARPLDAGPALQLMPFWNVSPAGSLSGGGVLSLRW